MASSLNLSTPSLSRPRSVLPSQFQLQLRSFFLLFPLSVTSETALLGSISIPIFLVVEF